MEIIEHGNTYNSEPKRYIQTCRYCNCKFEFTSEDTYRPLCRFECSFVNAVKCPECRAELIVVESNQVK